MMIKIQNKKQTNKLIKKNKLSPLVMMNNWKKKNDDKNISFKRT